MIFYSFAILVSKYVEAEFRKTYNLLLVEFGEWDAKGMVLQVCMLGYPINGYVINARARVGI